MGARQRDAVVGGATTRAAAAAHAYPEPVTAPRARAALLLALTAGCAAAPAAPPAALPPAPAQEWRTAAQQAMSRLHTPAVADATCRQVLRSTAAGTQVRLRLSASGLDAPLRLPAVTVAVRTTGAAVGAATLRPITVGGRRDVLVPAGQTVTTDPVDLSVRAGDDVAVSFAVSGRARLPEHAVGEASGWCGRDGSGDLTGQAGPEGLLPAGRAGLVLEAVEVAAPGSRSGVLAVGDSLTDPPAGPDRYRRWTDRLAARLPGVPVANAAIGGNRVQLPGGYGPTLGQRYDTDVLGAAGIGTVVVLAGTNDVSAGLSARELEGQLQVLCARARAAGLRVVLGTLPPAHRRPAAQEAVRLEVDRWVRSTDAADAVLDADALLRDPSRPDRLRPAHDLGDGLHLSDEGHRVLGDAVADLLADLDPVRPGPRSTPSG